jgi:hypothetical protein
MLSLGPENVSLLIHAGIVTAGPSDGSRSSYFAFAISAVIRARNFPISFRMLWRSGPGGSLRVASNSSRRSLLGPAAPLFRPVLHPPFSRSFPFTFSPNYYKAEAILRASRSRACRSMRSGGPAREITPYARVHPDDERKVQFISSGRSLFSNRRSPSVSCASAGVVALGERSGT